MTQDEQGYNGWKNYETWVTALWIDNEQPTYEESRRMARAAVEDAPHYERTPQGHLADQLKEWTEELYIDPITEHMEASLATDLLRASFGEVDWYEIAENYLSEISQDA